MSTYFIIPARKNSKGFKFKNRFLFEKLPQELKNESVIVTSDDEVIREINNQSYQFDFIKRPDHLSLDTTSIKPVLQHVVEAKKVIGRGYTGCFIFNLSRAYLFGYTANIKILS